MSTPAFVIHGIGTRDEVQFGSQVATLGEAAGLPDARPVFWGDLGARYEYIDQTLPDRHESREQVRGGPDGAEKALRDQTASFLAAGGTDPPGVRTEVRGLTASDVPQAVLAGLRGRTAWEGTELRDVPAPSSDVELTLAEEWPRTVWLWRVDDTELQLAVGRALVPLEFADEANVEVRGPDVGRFVRRRLADLDRVVGAAFGAAGGRLNHQLRTSVLPGATRLVGDILVYQRHQERIQQRVRERIAGVDQALGTANQPVDVIAHSLGGVVAFDMATTDRAPLHIRRLVTFGSQAAFFHVCDPRGGGLAGYDGSTLVRLPPTIGGWTNLWEPLDVVAFIAAKVFQLHDGSPPDDRPVGHLVSSGFWTHSSYWGLDSVAKAIGGAVATRASP